MALVMFSKAEISLPFGGSLEGATFGPISIHPDYKRKGYFVADENPEAFEAYDATFPKKVKENH